MICLLSNVLWLEGSATEHERCKPMLLPPVNQPDDWLTCGNMALLATQKIDKAIDYMLATFHCCKLYGYLQQEQWKEWW